MTDPDERVDVLVLAGPGLGHVHPIAGFIADLVPPDRVAMAAELGEAHPARARIDEAGFRFVEWGEGSAHGHGDRVLKVVRRTLVRRAGAARGRRGGASEQMPNLASRATFALASMLTPLSRTGAARGRTIEHMLVSLRPKLVLAEGEVEWLRILCARHEIPWAQYTTGPVYELGPHRPTEPAGLDPALRGLEGAVNRVLLSTRRVRDMVSRRRVRRAAGEARPHTAEPVARFAFTCASLDDIASRPATWSYLGLSPYKAPADWWVRPTDDVARDTILVTWGSGRVGGERELLERLLPVLVELSSAHRVVVQSGDADLRDLVSEALADSPEALVLPPHRAPQYDEYRRARLVISHGGYGTINESVAFGSPILVLPELVADRMETARRVLHAGVGRSVNRYTATTESLRTTIMDVLADDDVRTSVASVGAVLRDRRRREEMFDRLRCAIEASND